VEPLPEAPVFDIPVKRLSYVQLGSVERGSAILMVQGARKLGYPSFVAAGTNPNVFRVLVGPFPKPAEYQTAQTLFKSMGLDTFERIYADAAEAARPSKP
jgi:cell division septation protein DedD